MEEAPMPRVVDENTYVREITATDHINKSLAEAYLGHIRSNNVEFDSFEDSEEWDDPNGASCMSTRIIGEEDTTPYLRAEKEE